MSIFRRRELRQWAPEPIIPPFPGVSLFGTGSSTVSIDQALRTSAVWACVQLLSNAVSMMPLHAYTLRNGVREPIPDPQILTSPSSDATLPDFLHMVMTSALLRGNAYGRIARRDSMGYPTQIELYNPDDIFVKVDPATGRVVYRTRGGELNTADVWHFRAFRFPGSPLGMSPISYAATQIQTDLAVGAFAQQFFDSKGHPTAILSTEEKWSQDQARGVKDRFREAVNAREPAVLSGGVKYQAIQIRPEESQFLQTRQMNIADISRIFNIQPELIAGAVQGTSLTYASREQRSLDFLVYSVQNWMTKLETAFATLLPGQKHTRFDTSVLLRTDMETMAKSTAIRIASHQLLPDEARQLFDLRPFTTAEKAEADLVPMTVTPSGLPKATPGAAAAGEPATTPPVGQGATV